MLKKLSFFLLLGILLFISASAQKIEKPTLTPVEPTEEQKRLIRQGTTLHDEQRYDEAIKLYEQVLKENPDCVLAMYEMAYSYYAKRNPDKTLEIAQKAARYKSDLLPLIYVQIGSAVDDKGNSKKAIEIYKEALKLMPNETRIHYNLGLTYFRTKQYNDAKESLKRAVISDFSYSSPNYLLAETFRGMRYKTPALLAAARLLSLEPNTERSKKAAQIFHEVLQGGLTQGSNPNQFNITLDITAPKDEGDFGALELIIGLVGATDKDKEENKNKTEEEKFISKIESVIGFLDDDKFNSTFVGKTYIPFMVEMKKRGFVKIFAYISLQQSGNLTAASWLRQNSQQTSDFINWSRGYKPGR